MLENGFIVLHRKMTNWEWYTDCNTKSLFLHLILTANYEPQKWRGIVIERGQRVASLNTLSKETGMSVKNIRTALKHLKSTNEVASKSTSRYTIFTVVNYDFYQDKGQTKGQTTGKQRANKGQTRGNNETKLNKYNKENKEKQECVELNSSAALTSNFSSAKCKYGIYENVTLSNKQYEQLVNDFGEDRTNEYIDLVDKYCEKSGKQYKNYFLTISDWIKEDCAEEIEVEKPRKEESKRQ